MSAPTIRIASWLACAVAVGCGDPTNGEDVLDNRDSHGGSPLPSRDVMDASAPSASADAGANDSGQQINVGRRRDSGDGAAASGRGNGNADEGSPRARSNSGGGGATSSRPGGVDAGTGSGGVTTKGNDGGSGGGVPDDSTDSACNAEQISCGIGATPMCVDPLTSRDHCGGCDSACASDVACSSGACELPRCRPTFKLGGLPTVETDGAPYALAVGDLNGDGYPDIATANFDADTVSVLLGDGHGGLVRGIDLPTEDSPSAIVVLDANRDGRLDLATANTGDDSVSVLMGRGDGTFGSPERSPVGVAPVDIAVADFDDDGVPDMVTANSESKSVSVLLGSGDGTFAGEVRYATGYAPSSVVAGDVNQDGAVDLAIGESGAIGVLLGTGEGTFTSTLDMPVELAPKLALGDVNGDGAVDLTVAAPSGRQSDGMLGVLFGKDDGSFTPLAELEPGRSPIIGTADLNGDGRSEIVVSTNSALTVLSVIDDGAVATAVDYLTISPPTKAAFGDFNADGWPDIAMANLWGISVLMATGDGNFDVPERQPTGADAYALLLDDLDADGLLDLATTTGTETVSVQLGLGDGTFAPGRQYRTGAGYGSLEAGDLDGDGHPELVMAGESENGLYVLWNAGDTTYPSRTDYELATRPEFVALADLNEDAQLDIVTASGSLLTDSATTVLINQGNGILVPQVHHDGKPWAKLALVDLNHDGRADLVGSNGEQDGLIVALGLGDGSFGDMLKSPTNGSAISTQSAALGDLDGDGELDLVAPDLALGSTQLAVMLGVGDGTFTPAAPHRAENTGAGTVTLADIDDDGILDLLWLDFRAFVGGETIVALGVGDGTFGCSTASLSAATDGPFALGDVNGDRRIDLLVPQSQSVLVLLNQPL